MRTCLADRTVGGLCAVSNDRFAGHFAVVGALDVEGTVMNVVADEVHVSVAVYADELWRLHVAASHPCDIGVVPPGGEDSA